MKQNSVKDVIRKQLMKECRECYDIFAEDEKKAIIWDNDGIAKYRAEDEGVFSKIGITYLVDKKRKVVMMLIPLYIDVDFDEDGKFCVFYDNPDIDDISGYTSIEDFSNGVWWREDGNQVIEMAEDSADPLVQMLYHDFFNK